MEGIKEKWMKRKRETLGVIGESLCLYLLFTITFACCWYSTGFNILFLSFSLSSSFVLSVCVSLFLYVWDVFFVRRPCLSLHPLCQATFLLSKDIFVLFWIHFSLVMYLSPFSLPYTYPSAIHLFLFLSLSFSKYSRRVFLARCCFYPSLHINDSPKALRPWCAFALHVYKK